MSSASGLTLAFLLMWIIAFAVYHVFVCLFVILNILYGSWLSFLIILLLVILVTLLLLLSLIIILLNVMTDDEKALVNKLAIVLTKLQERDSLVTDAAFALWKLYEGELDDVNFTISRIIDYYIIDNYSYNII